MKSYRALTLLVGLAGFPAFGMYPCNTIFGPQYPNLYEADSRRLLQAVDEIRELERTAVNRKVRLILGTSEQPRGRGTLNYVDGTVIKVDVDGTNRNTVSYTLKLTDGTQETFHLFGVESVAILNTKRLFL